MEADYWTVVHDCLITKHNLDDEKAKDIIYYFRYSLQKVDAEEVIYNTDEEELADNLSKMNVEDFLKRINNEKGI